MLLESNKDRVDGAMELYRRVIEGKKFRGKFLFIFIIILQLFFFSTFLLEND